MGQVNGSEMRDSRCPLYLKVVFSPSLKTRPSSTVGLEISFCKDLNSGRVDHDMAMMQERGREEWRRVSHGAGRFR